MIRHLKKIKPLVKVYQKLIGYDQTAKQWCRVVMDRETEKMVTELDYKSMNVFEISGSKWKNFGFASYKTITYPEFDICKDKLDEQFDLIIAEQVFEHLSYPFRAGKNVYSMLKPGGYFLVTLPFLIKIHDSPDDCSRWSRSGLSFFLEECGFPLKQVETFSWGNRKCIVANFNEWMPYNPKKHSLENEVDFPIVVWALAKKQN